MRRTFVSLVLAMALLVLAAPAAASPAVEHGASIAARVLVAVSDLWDVIVLGHHASSGIDPDVKGAGDGVTDREPPPPLDGLGCSVEPDG